MQSNVFNGIIAGGHKPFCKQATSYLLRRSNHRSWPSILLCLLTLLLWECNQLLLTLLTKLLFPAKGPPRWYHFAPSCLLLPLYFSLLKAWQRYLSRNYLTRRLLLRPRKVVLLWLCIPMHTPCQRMVAAATTPMSVVLHRHEPPPWCWPWNHCSQWRTVSWTSWTILYPI